MTNSLIVIGWLIPAILSYVVGEKLHFTQRKKEKLEKFENAIQDWALDGLFKDMKNKYEGFSHTFNSWKSKHKNEHSIWLRTHEITELNDFYSWMAKRCEETNCGQCWIDFWNNQKK